MGRGREEEEEQEEEEGGKEGGREGGKKKKKRDTLPTLRHSTRVSLFIRVEN